jgi:hypothetical protein
LPVIAYVNLKILQNERFVPPTDGRNITGDFDPAVHGFGGVTLISLPNQLQKPFDERFFNAANELGGNFKFNRDMNSGKPLGASRCFEYLCCRCNVETTLM